MMQHYYNFYALYLQELKNYRNYEKTFDRLRDYSIYF